MLFSHYFQCLNLNLKNLKIQDGGRLRRHFVALVAMEPIKQQVVSINWKYKERSLYMPNI